MNDSSERFRFSTRTSHLRFENGLEVLVLRDDFAPVVSVQGWVRVGSMHEEEFLGGGISHLIEHLVFKGTKNFGGQEIAKAVQAIGGQLNAYTSFDRTVYYVDGPAEGWETAMRVVSDLIFFPEFPEDEFEREKEVIRREIAMGKDDPERVLGEALFKLCFAGHPCRHPVIGYLEAFNQITLDAVKRFHARHYAPNNVFLVITGDVSDKQVEEWVETNLSSVERRMRAPVVLPTEPRQVGARRDIVSFDTEVSRVDLAWRIPALTHPDMPVLDVMARILGAGRSSRLYREIREEQQLAHSVSASSYTPGHEGLFVLNADAEPAKVDALIVAFRKEIAKIINEGVSDDELEKARRGVLAGMYGGLSTTSGLASQLGGAWMLTGGLDLACSYLNGVSNVDSKSIQRVAKQWLEDDAECLVVVNPSKSAEADEAIDPVQETKIAKKLMPDVQPTQLGSGLEVLVGSSHRVPLVAVQFAFVAGSQSDPIGKAGLARLAARTLLKGTQKRDSDSLMNALESRGGWIAASAGNNTLTLGLSVMRDDLTLAMELASEVLTMPLIPQAGLELERAAQLQGIREANDHLVSVAMRRAREIMYAGTQLEFGAAGNETSVASITHDDVTSFIGEHLVGTGGVVSVFGDAEYDEAVELLQAIPLEAGSVNRSAEVAKIVAPTRSEELVTVNRDKQQGVVVIAFPCPGVGHPDHIALQLINEATSDMSSRLFQRIREEQGLAYYVSSSMFMGIGGGMFSFYLGTDPEKLDHAEAEMRAEILRLVTAGLDDEELFRAKQSMRGSLIMQSQSHSAMGAKAVIDHLLGMGWNAVENDLKEIESLTREDVAAVASKWLLGSGVTVRVLP